MDRLTNSNTNLRRVASERRSRGSAMVEMVIVLPLLLTILLGIGELSIAMMRWQTIGNAAREGAREGSLFRPNCTLTAAPSAQSAAADALTAANITGASITVAGTCISPGSTTVTVSAPYNFTFLPNFVPSLPASLNLTSTSVMRNSNLAGA